MARSSARRAISRKSASYLGEQYGDMQVYTKGSYFAVAAPWGAGSFTRPADYQDTIYVRPQTFPAGTRIRSVWTALLAALGGFMLVGFGNYNWTVVQNLITPLRIDSITTLRAKFAYRMFGSPNFDILSECYLTATPHQWDALSDKKFEVGFIYGAKQSIIDWINSGTVFGVWADSKGKQWKCTGRQGGDAGYFIILFPLDEKTVTAGDEEWDGLLPWLVSLNISVRRKPTGQAVQDETPTALTDQLYVNGLGFGYEVAAGGGEMEMIVDEYEVEWA